MGSLRQAHDDYPRLDVWLSGLPADSYDAIDAVYGLLPLMAAATCSLVLLLVGVSFQSAVIPLVGKNTGEPLFLEYTL